MKITIISGSARPLRQSHQVALAIEKAVKANYPNISTWMFDVKEERLPLLDDTLANQKQPSDQLLRIGEALADSDGFIIVTPEHNGTFTGALKNSMDYFLPQYANKVMSVVAVSAGMLGGINAAKNLQVYALHLKGIVLPQYLLTPNVAQLFTEGELSDDAYEKRINVFLEKMIWLMNKLKK